MLVLRYTALGRGVILTQMQSVVSMVMVLHALPVHRDMGQLARPLLHCGRAKHAQRLPQ